MPTSAPHLRILVIDRNDKVFSRHTESSFDIHIIIPYSESLLAYCAVTHCLSILGMESMSTESRLLARTILRCFLGDGGEVACQSSNINSTQSKLHFSPSSSNQITIAFRRSSPNTKELRKERRANSASRWTKNAVLIFQCPKSKFYISMPLLAMFPRLAVHSNSASLNLFKLSKESEFLLREKGQINGQF